MIDEHQTGGRPSPALTNQDRGPRSRRSGRAPLTRRPGRGRLRRKVGATRSWPVLALIVVGALVAAAAPATPAPGEWPQFRSDPAHSGSNPTESLLTPAAVAAGLGTAWTGAASDFVNSSPAWRRAGLRGVGRRSRRLRRHRLGQLHRLPQDVLAAVDGGHGKRRGFLARGGGRGGLRAGRTTTSSTPSTPPARPTAPAPPRRARRCGRRPRATSCSPRRRWWAGWSTWGRTTASSTPSTPPDRPDAGAPPRRARRCGRRPREAYRDSSPAVAGGVVYVGTESVGEDHNLYAFDAAGSTNCAGTPKTCTPLWVATMGSVVYSSPAVAGGVVYVGSENGLLYAFDAAGVDRLHRHAQDVLAAVDGGHGRHRGLLAGGGGRGGLRGVARHQALRLRRRRRPGQLHRRPQDLLAALDGGHGRRRAVLASGGGRGGLRGVERHQALRLRRRRLGQLRRLPPRRARRCRRRPREASCSPRRRWWAGWSTWGRATASSTPSTPPSPTSGWPTPRPTP